METGYTMREGFIGPWPEQRHSVGVKFTHWTRRDLGVNQTPRALTRGVS